MTQKNADSVNVFEQISQICRDFRKQISQGRSPRIEKYLSAVTEDGRETLFSNLLEIELRFRQSKGQNPTSEEYLKRFSQYAKQVRRAFFEPTMASIDSGDGDDRTRSLNDAFDASEHTLTFQIPDANRLGDYELIRELGRGGMGVVYEARHTKTNNQVALKTLPTGGRGQEVNADKLYRFRKEFRRLSEINHPNLVGMQTLEVDGSQWFFTMDLINGEDFLSYVRPEDKLNEQRLRSCLEQLARGIIALHRERIVHRDLKPSNVLVSSEGHVSILDFGLAVEMQRTHDMTQTKSGMFAGTPRYAAPEQMFGERTEASDWYAFGTMLYEALVGEPPFTAKDQMQLLRDKQNLEAPSLNDRSYIEESLAQIADGLIRRQPDERMNVDSVAHLLELNLDTRSSGSTTGSQGSTGSVSGEELDLESLEEEEVVLIGREHQLAQLEAIKKDFLKTCQPQVVWVTGLSGEGKSSLVHKFLRPIRKGEEMLVLSGRCYDRESVPFKAIDSFVDPLVRFLRSRSESELKNYLPEDIGALAKLFPVLGRIEAISNQDTRKLAGLDDRQIYNLAFTALKELLTNISHRFPIVIFVDDLQWGDADSAEAILNQLGSDKPPKVLLLGSYRIDEMDQSPFWEVWKKRLESQNDRILQKLIEVSPLSPKQAAEMVTARTGIALVDIRQQVGELIDESHGNPYFLEQLIEGFDESTGKFRALPLNEIIDAKLRRLPMEAADILDTIAVAGKAAFLDEVSKVSGMENAAFSLIGHMRSERLVRLVGSGENQLVDSYHDKIREAILHQIDGNKRKKLHERYAATIETLFPNCKFGARGYDLAHHFFEAGHQKAFSYQLHAGINSLEAGAIEASLEHLEKANQCLPVDATASDKFQLIFATALANSRCQNYDLAIDQFNVAIGLASSRSERANTYIQLGEIYWKKSDYTESRKCTRLGFSEFGIRLPSTILGKGFAATSSVFAFHLIPPSLNVRLRRFSRDELELLSRMYGNLNANEGQIDVFFLVFAIIRGCVVAKQSNDLGSKTLSYPKYAFALRFTGETFVSRHLIRRAAALAAQLPELPGRYLLDLGAIQYLNGEHVDAEKNLLQSERELVSSGDYQLWTALHFLWHLWSIRGNSSEIIHYADREGELAKTSNDQILLAYSEYGRAEGLARQGRRDEAFTSAHFALNTLGSLNATFTCVAHIQLARVQLQFADYAGARENLQSAIRMLPWMKFFEISYPALPLFIETVVSPDWHMGRKRTNKRSLPFRVNVYAWLSKILSLPFLNQRPPTFRALGRLSAAKGKQRKAKTFFDKAVSVAQKIGAEYELARTQIDKSMLDYPDAQSDREKGLELLESLGCVLPDAEVEYLKIDRAEHHARAAAARDQQSTKGDGPAS